MSTIVNTTKIKSQYPPIVVNTGFKHFLILDGKWMQVDSSFTLEDGYKLWERPQASKKTIQKTWQVKSSRNNELYTVKCDNGAWSCTCTGFGFRRDCKHIQSVKQ